LTFIIRISWLPGVLAKGLVKELLCMMILAAMGSGLLYAFSDRLEYSLYRLTLALDFVQGGNRDTSLERRQWYIDQFRDYMSSRTIPESAFGLGLGNFSKITDSDRYLYPHNVLIEIIVELGLLGAVLFSASICESFYLLYANRIHLGARTVAMLAVVMIVYLFFSMSHGDMSVQRHMFFWIFLCANSRALVGHGGGDHGT
jgi:hypothetical protein